MRCPGFAGSYLAALTSTLLVYLVMERYYFADGEADLVMLGYVAVVIACWGVFAVCLYLGKMGT